jgi:hypothetical protein
MVLPELRRKVERLKHDLAKAQRAEATADQQIAVSAWQLQRRKNEAKKARQAREASGAVPVQRPVPRQSIEPPVVTPAVLRRGPTVRIAGVKQSPKRRPP